MLVLNLILIGVSISEQAGRDTYDAICSLLQLSLDEYIEARDGLIERDLVGFDGTIFQVLDLPAQPAEAATSDPPCEQNRALDNLIEQTCRKV